jgi:hypothetical protein
MPYSASGSEATLRQNVTTSGGGVLDRKDAVREERALSTGDVELNQVMNLIAGPYRSLVAEGGGISGSRQFAACCWRLGLVKDGSRYESRYEHVSEEEALIIYEACLASRQQQQQQQSPSSPSSGQQQRGEGGQGLQGCTLETFAFALREVAAAVFIRRSVYEQLASPRAPRAPRATDNKKISASPRAPRATRPREDNSASPHGGEALMRMLQRMVESAKWGYEHDVLSLAWDGPRDVVVVPY